MGQNACREILQQLMRNPCPTKKEVDLLKIEVARKHNLTRLPSNSQLIRHLRPHEKAKLLPVLRRKVIRTLSGVSVVAVMTKPWPCPQKDPCAYCPGGPKFGVPQSYTGKEPASMRGLQSHFDPFRQVTNRIEQLRAIGHDLDKVELIIMGGTFPGMPTKYQKHFVKKCLDAVTQQKSSSLAVAMKHAETSGVRNVGITVETRPDWAQEKHVDHMLSMGVTRVELGVQNIYDDIYNRIERGHRVYDVIVATRVLKDAGLKVAYHLMPGLPGSSFERDLEGFNTIFTDANFKPDMIKIYPCLVLKGTKIYEWWKRGEYQPYTTEEAVQLILEIKKRIPPWIRIMRIQRDIPAYLIEAGVRRSNLRQLVRQELKDQGLRCRCIRCREVGHRELTEDRKYRFNEIQIQARREKASGGEEVFIAAEDPVADVLFGYLRLRIPSERTHRREIQPERTAIVRELHVYGPVVPVGRHVTEAWQHKGVGRQLLSKAECISLEEYERRKLLITSALGTKQYYRLLGYKNEGPYVSKLLV